MKRSVIPNYDTDKIKTHNIEIIKLILFKQPKTTLNNSKLLTELNEEQLTFIYKKINIENTELLSITEESINNRIYLHLTAKTKLYLWDTRNQILLCDYKIKTTENNKKIILTEQQFNLSIEEILNIPENELIYNTDIQIPFRNWSETETNINETAYYEAPVGSRKSSLRMLIDIEAILSDNPENLILMPCDTISLSMTHLRNMTELFNKLKLNIDDLKHYQQYKIDARQFNLTDGKTNIRLLICCYDSIKKFKNLPYTHIIIDEYVNVRKRFTQIHKENNGERIECLDLFFDILRKSKAIKCYDADLPNRDLELLKRATGKQFTYYKYQQFIQANNTVIFTNHRRMTNMILADINNNKNLTISTTTRKKAEELYTLLIQSKANIKICIIEGNGKATDNLQNTQGKWSDKLKIELISDTSIWVKYNVVIWTPTIITGLSQESNQYFYRHYGFCGVETTDIIQTAQMLFRVRNTETHEIVICDNGDRVSYFKNLRKTEAEIITDIQEKRFGKDSFIMNKTALLNYSHTAILDEYNDILEIEIANREQFYYSLFYSLKKWGCINLLCRFYDKESETDYVFKQTTKVLYEDISIINVEDFDDFINIKDLTLLSGGLIETGLDPVNKIKTNIIMKKLANGVLVPRHISEPEPVEAKIQLTKLQKMCLRDNKTKGVSIEIPVEIIPVETPVKPKPVIKKCDLYKQKMLGIMRFGYSEYLYNKYNHTDLFNYVVFNIYKSALELTIYSKIQKLVYYSARKVIYKFVELAFSKCDMKTLYLKQKNHSDTDKLIKWLFSTIVIFKIGEVGDNTELENWDYFLSNITTQCGGLLIMRKHEQNSVIESLSIIEQLYNILHTAGEIKSKNKTIANGGFEDAVKYAFNYFNTQIKIGLVATGDLVIEYKRSGIPYRREVNIYNSKTDYCSNDYDDILTETYNNETKYTTNYNRELSFIHLPKIRAYNKINNNRLIKRLKNYFNLYCSEENDTMLCDMLDIVETPQLLDEPEISKNTSAENMINHTNVVFSGVETGEIFKTTDITGYEISNLGRVVRRLNGEVYEIPILQLETPISNDRFIETFTRMGQTKNKQTKVKVNYVIINEYVYFVDRLVAKIFLDEYREDYFINHIDGRFENDNINNLCMVENWELSVYNDKDEKKIQNKIDRKNKAKETTECNNCKKQITYANISRHTKICLKSV